MVISYAYVWLKSVNGPFNFTMKLLNEHEIRYFAFQGRGFSLGGVQRLLLLLVAQIPFPWGKKLLIPHITIICFDQIPLPYEELCGILKRGEGTDSVSKRPKINITGRLFNPFSAMFL